MPRAASAVMRAGILAGALTLVAAGAAMAPQSRGRRAAPPVAPFQGSLAEAGALAADRNVPLLVVAVYEDEGWDPQDHHDQVEMRLALLEDRALAGLLERAVLALACNRPHPIETLEVGEGDQKRTIRRCSSYRTDSCAVHQDLFADAYAAWNEDGALVSPHVTVLSPGGEVSARQADGHAPDKSQLASMVQRAQKKAGAGLTAAEHAQVQALVATAREQAARNAPAAAWRAWDAVLEITRTTPHAPLAEAGSEAARAGVEAARDAALGALEAGRSVQGYTLLVDLAAAAEGTPLERELAKLVRTVESDKRHREAILAHKHELAGEAIEADIEALLRKGDERRAAAKLRGLLRRFGDTRAAARARERWSHLIGDD